jgi:hypothetical protein
MELAVLNGNPADSSLYDISVVALSYTKVKLTGNKTGEIATIVWSAGGFTPDQTYSSSNPAHESRTVYQNPTTCPNTAPDWWTAFLADNQKSGLPKRLAKTAVHAIWQGHLFAFPYLIYK